MEDGNPFLPCPNDETPTARGVNAAAAIAAAVGMGAYVVRPITDRQDEALHCIDCGACNAVGDACPGGIEDEAGLVAAARSRDTRAFVDRAGMMCTRCGICSVYCPVGLDLARIFGRMHEHLHEALAQGGISKDLVRRSLLRGQVGGEFIDDALQGLGER